MVSKTGREPGLPMVWLFVSVSAGGAAQSVQDDKCGVGVWLCRSRVSSVETLRKIS